MIHPDPTARTTEQEEIFRRFMDCREDFINAQLGRSGFAKHELTAQWEIVPEPIKKALPNTRQGFGLSGGFGVGKTFALVALLRRITGVEVDRHMAALLQEENWFDLDGITKARRLPLAVANLWCNWPGEVSERRAQLFQKQHGDVEDWIQGLQEPSRLVILDDLGADRVAGQDWAGEVLARVIDERLRRQGLTIWTSNLDAKGLIERYGPRTFSRLQSLAPMILLPKLPDLRLHPPQRPHNGHLGLLDSAISNPKN
jgi:hypothetical protein